MDTLDFESGEIVIGRGDYTYRKVIDDFANTTFIGILTYNISVGSGRTELLDALKTACKNGTKVILITNIPKRFSKYYSLKYISNTAKPAIKKYIELLNPENWGPHMSVYFQFHNHAKIIVTDNFIYCGSSNYSDESKENIECGTISNDVNLISYMKDTIFPEICCRSLPYYKYNVLPAIYSLREASLFCVEYKKKIFESAFYPINEHRVTPEEQWVYNSQNTGITGQLLQSFADDFEKFEDALKTIKTIVDEAEDDSEEINELYQAYEKYKNAYAQMSDSITCFIEDVASMASFNPEDSACDIICNKYGMESFDENLDYYAELAMDESYEEYFGLIESSKPAIQGILEDINSMHMFLKEMSASLDKYCFVNPKIDNT